MKKVAIFGSAGAGKSTLAVALGSILPIKVNHLDRIYWRPGWEVTPREKWIQIQENLVREDMWILDGTYLSTSDIRLKEADTIIFLDMPRWLCLLRVIVRHYRYRKRPRPDFSDECPDKLNLSYIRKVWTFPDTDRVELIEKMNKLALESGEKIDWQCSKSEVKRMNVGPEKEIVWLRSKQAVLRFLRELRSQPQEQYVQQGHSIRDEAQHSSESALVLVNGF